MRLAEALQEAVRVQKTKEPYWSPVIIEGDTSLAVGPHFGPEPFPGDWDKASDYEVQSWYESAPETIDYALVKVQAWRLHSSGREMWAGLTFSVQFLEDQPIVALEILRADVDRCFARLTKEGPDVHDPA